VVTDFVLNMFGDFFFFLLGLIPEAAFPEWMTGTGSDSLTGSLEWFTENIGPMAGWINMTMLASAVGFLVALEAIERVFFALARLLSLVRGGGF
jgi:hypothetical protein